MTLVNRGGPAARSTYRRALLAACVLAGMIAGGTVGWRAYLSTLEARREERATLTQMDRVPADAPLERWLPYTGMTGMPAVVARAGEVIRARRYLTFDLVGCLRRDDAPTRALVLEFVRGGGLPALSPESIPAARESLGAEAAAMRTRIDIQPDLTAVAFDPECLEAVFLAARYPGREAAFVEPLRTMRAVLDGLPRTESAPAGQNELETWLGRYAPGHLR